MPETPQLLIKFILTSKAPELQIVSGILGLPNHQLVSEKSSLV